MTIYILIFVAVAIFNFISKGKKQAAQSQSLPQPVEYELPDEYEEKEYKNPFEEIFRQEPPKQPEPVRVPVQMPVNSIVQPKMQTHKPMQRAESHLQHSTPKPLINTNTESFQPIDIDFNNTEELRKGIVFAEIFNRKYV